MGGPVLLIKFQIAPGLRFLTFLGVPKMSIKCGQSFTLPQNVSWSSVLCSTLPIQRTVR